MTVTNVVPTVTIDAAQLTTRNANQLPRCSRTSPTRAGSTRTPSSSVDPGTTYLANQAGTVAISDEGPPANVGTIQATLIYGDDGSFTVERQPSPTTTGDGSDTFGVTVTNVAPTATIDETGTLIVNGVPTVFADAGEPFPSRRGCRTRAATTRPWPGTGTTARPVIACAQPRQPGSDDPDPSPNVNPRDFIVRRVARLVARVHLRSGVHRRTTTTVAAPGHGRLADHRADPSMSRGAGYWQHQYKGNGKIDFTQRPAGLLPRDRRVPEQRLQRGSRRLDEAKAHDDIFVAGLKGTISEQLDRQLLTAWLNFANGGVEYTELLDTDGNGSVDTSFADVMATAEAVRLNPAATRRSSWPRRIC